MPLKVDQAALAKLSPKEREQVAAELRLVEEAFRDNPLLGYRPHGKQLEFGMPLPGPVPSWPRTRLYIGGNRSGKTTGTHVDTIVQCIDPDSVPDHLRMFKRWDPPFYCRIVGNDLTRWLEGVSLQKFREWCPRGQLHGGSFARAWDKQQMMLRFKNESWIQFMSNDQDLDKFAGAALHRMVYDEPPREDIWGECRARLIDYGGEELFGLTPLDGMSNWLYDMWYAPWERGELNPQKVRLIRVDMDDNPHLSEEDKEWALEGLSEEERDARKTGRFVSFSGLIYPEFSTLKHIVPQLPELPYGVEVFAGIDPGYRHMCAVLFAYLDADDDLVVFDEIAMPKTVISNICREIKLRCERWGIRPNWYVIDPAARNKNGQTGRSDQTEFADHGVYTVPGQNQVRPGINRVKERLAAEKLHIAGPCRELLSEFKKYRWMADSKRTENDPAEMPVKRDDHALDALRYICMARPLAPKKDGPRKGESMKDRLLRGHLKRHRRPAPDSGYGPGQFQ